VRVKAPKPAASLPLIVIGLGVVLTVCVGGCLGGGVLLFQLAQSAKPLEAEYTTTVGNIKLVRVDGGTFDMGAEGEAGAQPDEGPVRAVTISKGYYVGETEVTRQQYADVTGHLPRLTPSRVSAALSPRMPATVSWEEADDFLRKLNAREKAARGDYEFRLPTEAEWEFAARSGGKPAPFGDKAALRQYTHGIFMLSEEDHGYGESNPAITTRYTFEDKPCSIGAASGDTDYVYRREPNALGLFDTAGNVWELCHDRFDAYPPGPATDPTGPTSGTQRVARGGAHNTTAVRCRAAARLMVDPKKADPSVGFRVVYGPRLSSQ
jgi:formylglycine-generating enzyme required for sulfatase activity